MYSGYSCVAIMSNVVSQRMLRTLFGDNFLRGVSEEVEIASAPLIGAQVALSHLSTAKNEYLGWEERAGSANVYSTQSGSLFLEDDKRNLVLSI